MQFTSVTFLVFLLLVLLTYRCIGQRWRMPLLILASYVFYGWVKPIFVPLLFLSTCIHYVAGRLLARTEAPGWRRLITISSVALDLSLLAWFKYAVLFFALGGWLWTRLGLHPPQDAPHVLLPTAIAFYTLQSIGYTVDVYRRKYPAELNFLRFSLYVAFFPQLVAGPIERAGQLLPQLKTLRLTGSEELRSGAVLIAWGLFKKLVVADRLATFCDAVLSNPDAYAPIQAFLAPYVFMYRLYTDLGGYTDVAVGVGILFGVRLMANFDRPFIAITVRGMWQRWHISLTRWMMEFVYLPLARLMPNTVGRALATIAVFVLIGLWHGPSANYIVFGFVMGSVIVLCDLRRRWLKPPAWLLVPERWRPWVARPASWTVMAATAAVFAGSSLTASLHDFARAAQMFTGNFGFSALLAGPPLSPYDWALLLAGVGAVEWVEAQRRNGDFSAALSRLSLPWRWGAAYALGATILMFGQFTPLPFYYFRF